MYHDVWFWIKIMINWSHRPSVVVEWCIVPSAVTSYVARTSRSRSGQDAARSDFFGNKILRQQNFEATPKHFSPPSSPQTPVTAGVGGCWTAKLNLKRNPQILILKYMWNSQRESSIKRIWDQSCQKFQSMFSQIHLVSLLYTCIWADYPAMSFFFRCASIS